jgi:LAO/AO transport system kinase
MEAADLVVVNKADGSLLTSAKQTKADYTSGMFFIRQKYDTWQAPVMLASAATDIGIHEVIQTIDKFHKQMAENGTLMQKRAGQSEYWMQNHLQRQMMRLLTDNEGCKRMIEESKQSLQEGSTTPRAAASKVMSKFIQSLREGKEHL